MAGDWIKMRSDLIRHPKVCVMADLLMSESGPLARYVSQFCQRNMSVTRNVTRNACVGALVSVWGVFRHRGTRIGDDLIIEMATLFTIDDVADLPGFGEAMEAVGWVEEMDSGLKLPRFFEEMNVEAGREKSKGAERQSRYRERKKQAAGGAKEGVEIVTSHVTSRNALEKRREEKSSLLRKEGARAKAKRFARPTVEEVTAFASELGNRIDAQKFWDYYESNGWKVGRNAMKDWKATVRNWLKRQGEFDGSRNGGSKIGPGQRYDASHAKAAGGPRIGL